MPWTEYRRKLISSDWETLAQRMTITRLCAVFKACSWERAREAKLDSLRKPYYLIRFDHVRKIRDKNQRTVIGN